MNYIAIFIGFLLIAVGANLLAVQIPSEGRARAAVENLGMDDAKVVSRSPAWGVFGGCKESDVTKFTVEAFDSRGRKRTIEICAPIIGGYTIRS